MVVTSPPVLGVSPGAGVTGAWVLGGGSRLVSVGGGRNSRWSRTGKQIFYTDESWNLMVVDYTIQGDTFQAGKPRRWMEQRLMRLANNFSAFDVTPDGKRVVALPSLTTPDPSSGNLHFTFLQNFFDELKRRIP